MRLALQNVYVPWIPGTAANPIGTGNAPANPTVAGFFAHGPSWTAMGPWQLGRWYRPLAVLSAVFCVFLIVIGMQPPNQQAFWIVGGVVLVLTLFWFGFERRRFEGPPKTTMVS